jgi:glycosyltransferase involved in cell wall biosynthesis
MKVLFVTAHPYLPQMYGGLQNSTDQLCRGLLQRGHVVAVLAALIPTGRVGWASRIKIRLNDSIRGGKVSRDTGLGYPIWRAWFPWEAVTYVAGNERPDLIVVLAVRSVRMALAARSTGRPILMQLQDVEFSKHDGEFGRLGNVPCVANSRFTAAKYRRAYGVDPAVIYPFVALEKYRTHTTRENVTFVNPVTEKGRDIAIEIAGRCPHIPFAFVEAWPLSPEQRSELMQRTSSTPNVTLFTPRNEMRTIYGKAKILLAPSIWEEGYGRIATEAQASGIPVIASTRGGLPEAVGAGGILIDPDGPIEDWIAAVDKLWRDDQCYAELSKIAVAYANRDENSIPYKIDLWERALREAIAAPSIMA